jgi:hypothetical protein
LCRTAACSRHWPLASADRLCSMMLCAPLTIAVGIQNLIPPAARDAPFDRPIRQKLARSSFRALDTDSSRSSNLHRSRSPHRHPFRHAVSSLGGFRTPATAALYDSVERKAGVRNPSPKPSSLLPEIDLLGQGRTRCDCTMKPSEPRCPLSKKRPGALGDSGGSRIGQGAGAAAQAHFEAHGRHRKCEVFPNASRSAHPFYVEIPVEHRE